MRNEQNENSWQHSWRFAVSELCAVISSKGWTTEFSDSIYLSLIDLTTACVCDGSSRACLFLSLSLSFSKCYILYTIRLPHSVCVYWFKLSFPLLLPCTVSFSLFGLVEVKLSSTIHQVHQMKSYWVRRDYRIRFALRFTTRMK